MDDSENFFKEFKNGEKKTIINEKRKRCEDFRDMKDSG